MSVHIVKSCDLGLENAVLDQDLSNSFSLLTDLPAGKRHTWLAAVFSDINSPH